MTEKWRNRKTLEGLVSDVQTALLASATSSAQLDFPVLAAQEEDRKHVEELFLEFEKELISRGKQVEGPLPEDSVTLLAVLHGQYIGCVQIGAQTGSTVRLTRLYVREGWRHGRGPSASLVWKAIEYAAERMQGVTKVVIKESQAAPRILEFFRQQGFETDPDDPTGQQLQYPLAESTSRAAVVKDGDVLVIRHS